jgi:hypothetical protein
VLSGYDVSDITSQIESILQSVLMIGVCADSTGDGALAVSPEPADMVGSSCESNGNADRPDAQSSAADAMTTCHTIAGRATLVISSDTALDTAGIYCRALESIREYVASGALVALIDGIDAIETPLLARIIPALCNLLPDENQNGRNLAQISSAFDEPTSPAIPNDSSNHGTAYSVIALGCLVVGSVFAIVFERRRFNN